MTSEMRALYDDVCYHFGGNSGAPARKTNKVNEWPPKFCVESGMSSSIIFFPPLDMWYSISALSSAKLNMFITVVLADS